MLKDLNQLALEAKEKCDNYSKNEFVFSNEFKSKYLELRHSFTIKFYKYTSVVTTSNNLLIIVPNQWFVIASFFNEFISALKVYKEKVGVIGIAAPEIAEIRNSKNIPQEIENRIIDLLDNDPDDIIKFKRFLTDYAWWYGSKTIDRGDYFVSSVLNLASVINNSQAYIADIAYMLSDNQELVEILKKDYDLVKNEIRNKTAVSIFKDKVLRQVVFKSFKYILDKYGEERVLESHEIKDAVIEGRNYKGLSLNNYFGFETLIGQFDTEQTADELKSSGTPRFIDEKINILRNENSYFTSQWNGSDNGRGLTLGNFNKLLCDISDGVLEIIKSGDGYKLIEKSILTDVSPVKKTENVIFYGSPGTGKSHKVNEELKKINKHFYERITFHPEYDHASFVGGYKPISEPNDEGIDEVKYKFVPQVFTEIYKRAWKDPENHYFLVIEEINRGNCAEIFGDIFQLLDRNSNYTVTPSSELKEHLETKLGVGHEGIANGLKLPNNLTIWATMNTSDQSLFPMDSAFKRRWDWEYIPINYEYNDENLSSKFFVEIEDGVTFSWLKFIEAVNTKIKHNPNLGMDKCIGNYFIKPEDNKIELKDFISKAIFYLWNDVFKDEDERDSIFKKNNFYEDFFPTETKGKALVLEILKSDDFKNILETEAE